MPRRQTGSDRVWAVWVSSPPATRAACDESGPASWWWIQWKWHTLFGPEESEWHLIRVKRWVRLGVWLVYPEAADMWRLEPWTLNAEGGAWRPIPYGKTNLVRKLERTNVTPVTLVTPCDPRKWAPGSETT